MKPIRTPHHAVPLLDTAAGLAHYLATCPTFKGIGPAAARQLADLAGSAAKLTALLDGDLVDLNTRTRIAPSVLHQLRLAWIDAAPHRAVHVHLAAYELSHAQATTLIDALGIGVVELLHRNPYALIEHVPGYGFKRADRVARAVGITPTHPARLDAAVICCMSEQVGKGHTWTPNDLLTASVLDLLRLDRIDGRDLVQAATRRLLDTGDLIADGDAICLRLQYDDEQSIAAILRDNTGPTVAAPRHVAELPCDLHPEQLTAYRFGLTHRICVITGGAGTGKTYVLAHLAHTFRDAGLEVLLCAPTGKAAQRIQQTLAGQGIALPACTIHRALEFDGRRFNRASLSTPSLAHTAGHDAAPTIVQPGADVVIVDEASMIDVGLMAAILERIDFARTRLVLVGDHHQLPSVGPGNLLRDIVQHQLAPVVVLCDAVRQAGVLKRSCADILIGRVAPIATDGDAWIVIDHLIDPLAIQSLLVKLVLDRLPKRLGIDALRDVQIIVPQHKGPLGTTAINALMQHAVHGQSGRLIVGDKVIQTRNDYGIGVMNGTLGVVTAITGDTATVAFDGHQPLKLDADRQANLKLAYAMTAHKAQGSEFPCVVVICHRSHFYADRNWLYTATTRAARTCVLIGDRIGLHRAAAIYRAVARRTLLKRWSTRPEAHA